MPTRPEECDADRVPSYEDIALFSDVHLEESFVLLVSATPGSLTIYLEAYILTTSPLWRTPRPDEAGWWLPAVLTFGGVSDLHWTDGHYPPSHDATRAVDYGTIDSLHADGDRWTLHGGAGSIVLTASTVDLTIEPPD